MLVFHTAAAKRFLWGLGVAELEIDRAFQLKKMSKQLGAELPPGLLVRLSGQDLEAVAGKVILLSTVDERGYPHPALLSYFEVLALDCRTIRLATYADSRTTANARRERRLTLVIIDTGVVYYVKGAVRELAHSMRCTAYNAKLHLDVVEVLADEADRDREPDALVASGITYVDAHAVERLARARDILTELRE